VPVFDCGDFAMTSPHPLITNRHGSCEMTSVSAIIANGAWDMAEYGLPNPLMLARGLAIPSWLRVVGMLTNGICWWAELSFAASILVPPPMPKRDLGLEFCNSLFDCEYVSDGC